MFILSLFLLQDVNRLPTTIEGLCGLIVIILSGLVYKMQRELSGVIAQLSNVNKTLIEVMKDRLEAEKQLTGAIIRLDTTQAENNKLVSSHYRLTENNHQALLAALANIFRRRSRSGPLKEPT